jgi:iron complex transport system substrate-binding protein
MRIASLAPNATSILVELGARRNLVGVSRWCAEVAPVGKLPRLGDCWSLDVEAVMRLKPEMVIGSVPFRHEAVSKLLEHPVAFLALNPRSLDSIYADVRLLARLVEKPREGHALVQRMKNAFKKIAQQARRNGKRARPRVYSEAWSHPRISSPPWVAELIEIAGGEMAVPAGERVSDEAVAAARPDVILLAWTATGMGARPETALENPKWQDVPAIRSGRVVVLRDELLNTPGPPLIRGAEEIFRALQAPPE